MYQGEEGCKIYHEALKLTESKGFAGKNTILDDVKVKISLEDANEIAKDILKTVLKDLNVTITDAIDSLSNDSLSSDSTSDANEEVKEPLDVPTAASNIDFSKEKLQSMFEEVMKEYLRDSINTLNKTAFGI